MSLRTPLGRVLGRGSAKEGVHDWWMQRVSAVALIPLTVWFLVSLLALPAYDYGTLVAWMSRSWTALPLILFVLVSAYHSQLGVRVIVEDYVHGSGAKTVTLVLVTFAHAVIATVCVFAILKVAFGGVA